VNKNELITFLRNPNDLKESDLAELEKILDSSPYFLSGRLLLAKGSKELKHPDTKKRISSAAVYSTDRPLLKKYISGKLFFLSRPPEKEEIEEVLPPKPIQEKIEPEKEAGKSQKIEIITTPKEKSDSSIDRKEVKEKPEELKPKTSQPKEEGTEKETQRREPRFDPSATASFKRRWDTSESEPKDKAPEDKPVFAGKKIDRSDRVRKKSMRDELLSDAPPIKNTEEEIPKAEKLLKAETEEKVIIPKKVEKIEHDDSKSLPEPAKEKTQVVAPTSIPKPPESAKEKSTPSPARNFASEKSKTSEPAPQRRIQPKEEEPHTPVIIKATSKPPLEIPDVPSEGIDAILEELQRDLENLKFSRSKFIEVQQKIEEEDAVSAALERATSKIPKPEPVKKEVAKEIESISLKEEIKKEEKPEESSPKSEEISTEKEAPEKDEKEEAKEKPKTKKSSTINKPLEKKESSLKKTAAKKVSDKKTTAKPKSTKTKSTKKEEKKDDDKSGKQKIDQNSIIDKFITETPSIKYQKKGEPVQNKDLSDESSEWNKELASEYLAEIYLHQGNKKRAIEIYKALSLKFPNKKSYFADLISKTK
jgi:hypothetical protein